MPAVQRAAAVRAQLSDADSRAQVGQTDRILRHIRLRSSAHLAEFSFETRSDSFPIKPKFAEDGPDLTFGAGRRVGNFSCVERNVADRTLIEQKPVLTREAKMGRGILLWLLGVPIPVIIILALLFR